MSHEGGSGLDHGEFGDVSRLFDTAVRIESLTPAVEGDYALFSGGRTLPIVYWVIFTDPSGTHRSGVARDDDGLFVANALVDFGGYVLADGGPPPQ